MLNWGLEVGMGGARRRQRRFQYIKGWKRRQRQHRQIDERIIVEGGQVGRGGMRVVTAVIVVFAGDRVGVVVEDGMRVEVCAGLGPLIILNDGTNSIYRRNTIGDGYGDSPGSRHRSRGRVLGGGGGVPSEERRVDRD